MSQTRRPFRRRRLTPHIDMTPLIDCLFTLLIVFMLAAAFGSPMIQLTLPQARTQDRDQPSELIVSIDAKGSYFVNGQPSDPARLEETLRPLLARSKDRIVTFRGDEKIPYEWFVKVLDASRAAGAAHVEIAHQNPSPP